MGPLNLKSILKPGVGNTPLAEEARSGPLEATISALSTTYKEGQAVLCSYEGKNYPAKILEVSTKRKIEAINVMTQLAKEQHLNVDEMDVETPPLGNDDEDKILFYVHYIRWKPKYTFLTLNNTRDSQDMIVTVEIVIFLPDGMNGWTVHDCQQPRRHPAMGNKSNAR